MVILVMFLGLRVLSSRFLPDGSDFPSFPPNEAPGDLLPEDLVNNKPQAPEEIIQDLTDNLERLFGNEGRSLGNMCCGTEIIPPCFKIYG